jgi:hypothetical protein
LKASSVFWESFLFVLVSSVSPDQVYGFLGAECGEWENDDKQYEDGKDIGSRIDIEEPAPKPSHDLQIKEEKDGGNDGEDQFLSHRVTSLGIYFYIHHKITRLVRQYRSVVKYRCTDA